MTVGRRRARGTGGDRAYDRSVEQIGSDTTRRLTVFVRGRVQGVGFRWWTRARALELGLAGQARNTPDGRVEVVARGRSVTSTASSRCWARSRRRPAAPARSSRCRARCGTNRAGCPDSARADLFFPPGAGAFSWTPVWGAQLKVGMGRDSWDGRGRHTGADGALPTRAAVPTMAGSSDLPPELARLRSSIDNIDAALSTCSRSASRAPRRSGSSRPPPPPAGPRPRGGAGRPAAALADEAGLDPQFAEAFLAFIIAEVIRHHEHIAERRAGRLTRPHPHHESHGSQAPPVTCEVPAAHGPAGRVWPQSGRGRACRPTRALTSPCTSRR